MNGPESSKSGINPGTEPTRESSSPHSQYIIPFFFLSSTLEQRNVRNKKYFLLHFFTAFFLMHYSFPIIQLLEHRKATQNYPKILSKSTCDSSENLAKTFELQIRETTDTSAFFRNWNWFICPVVKWLAVTEDTIHPCQCQQPAFQSWKWGTFQAVKDNKAAQ